MGKKLKTEINTTVKGWGVWIETIEITDVNILSNALFTNLQTEFRESQRQNAEIIMMNTKNELDDFKLNLMNEKQKLISDFTTQLNIFNSEENFKVHSEQQKMFIKEQELKKKEMESNNKLKLYTEKKNIELKNYANDLEHNSNILTLDNYKKIKLDENKLAETEYETNLISKKNLLEIENLKNETEYNNMKLDGQLENEIINNMDYNRYIINSIENIYKNTRVSSEKIVQLPKSLKNTDNLLATLIPTYNVLKKEVAL